MYINIFQGQTIDSEHLSELTEEEDAVLSKQNAFVKFDMKYLRPFFTRRFTQQVSVLYSKITPWGVR